MAVVIGALGAVPVHFEEYMKRIGVNACEVGSGPENSIAGTAKILRKVLSL